MAKISKKTTENNELKKETNAFVNLENEKKSSPSSSKRKIRNITLKKDHVTSNTNTEMPKEKDIKQHITTPISEIPAKEVKLNISRKTQKNETNIENNTKIEKNIENNIEIEKNEKTSVKKVAPKKSKSKRTLHLNIKTDEKEAIEFAPSIPHVVDTSINQNSPFFSEPSVFEKLNITISSFDDEDDDIEIDEKTDENTDIQEIETIEESTSEDITDTDSENIESTEDVTDSEDVQPTDDVTEQIENDVENTDVQDIEAVEESISEDITDSENIESTEEVTDSKDVQPTNDVTEQIENDVENTDVQNIEAVEESISEDITDSENIESTEEVTDSEDVQPTDDVTEQIENDVENTDVQNIEAVEESIPEDITDSEDVQSVDDITDSITLDELLESDVEIDLEDLDTTTDNNDVVLQENTIIDTPKNSNTTSNLEIEKEIAENIKNEFVESAGKISDEPSHPSSILKNTVKKVSSALFNTSSIFKSFTFEDVNFFNNGIKNIEPIENINNTISNSQSPEIINLISENSSSKIIDNTSTPTIETSAEPIMTKIADLNTTSIDIKNTIDFSNDLNSESNINYNAIITPQENNNISIDEDLIDELITNSDFIDDEFDENDFDSYDEYSDMNQSDDLESELLDNDIIDDSEIEEYDNDENYDDSTDELLENEITNEYLESFKNKSEYDDDNFSIESYFGIDNLSDDEDDDSDTEFSEEDDTLEEDIDADIPETHLSPTEFENEFFKANDSRESNLDNNNTQQQTPEMVATFSKLIENFTETISTLSNRIADLETKKSEEPSQEQPILEKVDEENVEIISDDNSKQDNENTSDTTLETNVENSIIDDISLEDISDDELINELDIEPEDIENSLISEEDLESDISDDTQENNTNTDTNNLETEKSIEDILTDSLLNENLDQDLSNELLSEIISEQDIENSNIDAESSSDEINDGDLEESLLEDILLENIYQEDLKNAESQEKTTTISELTTSEKEPASDFLTIIDSLSKTISDLENSPDIKSNLIDNDNSGKSINILINKDDIFSISILNETYEIVTDFDGISVLSENIHISTPKNNFFVEIGEKYIEIHKKPDEFLVKTNFEDIEFVNSINNVAFGKKDNIIELNIKEAFKLSSVNNKVELSMLNTSIANISNTDTSNVDENSICDNRTLLISEETQKVYLPYTIEEIMKKLNNSDEYQTAKEVIENEYTLPLSTFKTPILSRFKEAYRIMRVKEKSSMYAAIDLGLELMFNSNLNPAVIRACKDLKELNIYLDCLYENELDKFDCFKIVYKVLPKIQ